MKIIKKNDSTLEKKQKTIDQMTAVATNCIYPLLMDVANAGGSEPYSAITVKRTSDENVHESPERQPNKASTTEQQNECTSVLKDILTVFSGLSVEEAA